MSRAFFIRGSVEAEALEESLRADESRAVVTFQGVVRRDREGTEELDHVIYEADLDSAEPVLLLLGKEILERWHGAELLFRHRLGPVGVGETSVFMAVSAGCREDALAACHHAAERLKVLPGLRKKDVFKDGVERWSQTPHETILLSDDAISLPQS